MLSHLSCVWLFATLWTSQCSLLGFSLCGDSLGKNTGWVAILFSRGSSWPRDWNCISEVSCIGRWILYHYHHLGSPRVVLEIAECSIAFKHLISWSTDLLPSGKLRSSPFWLSWCLFFWVSLPVGHFWKFRECTQRFLPVARPPTGLPSTKPASPSPWRGTVLSSTLRTAALLVDCACLNTSTDTCAVLASGLLDQVCPRLVNGTQERSLLVERKTLRFIFLLEGDWPQERVLLWNMSCQTMLWTISSLRLIAYQYICANSEIQQLKPNIVIYTWWGKMFTEDYVNCQFKFFLTHENSCLTFLTSQQPVEFYYLSQI